MGVPKLGIYTAADDHYKFNITSANPDLGEIRGTYETDNSRMGGWESELNDYAADGNQLRAERDSGYSWIAYAEAV